MIDYVHAMCLTWGHAKRRIDGIPDPSYKPPLDGPPYSGRASSFIGRIKERIGSGVENNFAQEPLEVLLGDALKVSVAIQLSLLSGQLTEKQYESLFTNYVVRGPIKIKLDKLRVGRKCFYERIHRAHKALEPWLHGDNVTGDKSSVA